MGVKNDIDITIGGKTVTLSGVESEEYLREVAAYLNEKLRNFTDDAAYWKLPNDMRNVMLQLNLADDFFKERSRVLALEEEVRELQDHRDRAGREIEDLRSSAEKAEARISALESDAEGLRDKAQRASAAETTASKRFGAEKSRAEKLAEELDALRRSKAEADKAVQRLRQELADTREGLQAELTRTRTDLEQKLSASESQRKKEVQDIQAQRKKEVQDIQTRSRQEVQEIRTKHQKELQEKDQTSARTLKEREDSLQKELTKTRQDLSGQLEAANARAGKLETELNKAAEEIKKLRSQADIARLNEENTRKKLTALEKDFSDKLAANTLQYRQEAETAREDLEKAQDTIVTLQEQENSRLQAAARIRGTMQDLVQQYGRLGQSLEEAAEQMRTLE